MNSQISPKIGVFSQGRTFKSTFAKRQVKSATIVSMAATGSRSAPPAGRVGSINDKVRHTLARIASARIEAEHRTLALTLNVTLLLLFRICLMSACRNQRSRNIGPNCRPSPKSKHYIKLVGIAFGTLFTSRPRHPFGCE